MSLLSKSSISNDSDDLMISNPFSTDAIDASTTDLKATINMANMSKTVDAQTYFDSLYDCNNDPWQYQTRWYEKRKRDICLAVLPQAQYRRAIELGCGNGVFSELLAERCQHLISLDGNEQAVQLARQRLTPLSHVDVIQGIIPHALSNLANLTNLTETDLSSTSDLDHHASFDLIVISEILYYLSPSDIDAVIAWAKQYLTPNGTLLCCHWRHPIDGFVMTGNTVHQRLDEAFSSANGQKDLFTHQTQMTDADFLLDVWQRSTDSVAMQENLV